MAAKGPIDDFDAAVIGGGAAGLATAIFAARHRPGIRVAILDGAKKLGAKILVSGGGRCNVTNRIVTPADFRGGNPHHVRRVLSAFTVEETVAFFNEIGVALHEEEHGKLFPNTNSARTVLDALLAEAARLGVRVLTDHRVTGIDQRGEGFEIVAMTGAHQNRPCGALSQSKGEWGAGPSRSVRARRVVLATGGKSLPKTGSDGGGYALAHGLGHSITEPTPALDPLMLDGDFHAPLSGVSQPVELCVRVAGAKPVRLRGSMLWTHFGVSGPVVLDASGLWHRARLAGKEVGITVSFLPGENAEAAEARLKERAAQSPKSVLRGALAELLPARVAEAVLARLGVAANVPLAHLAREHRRALARALVEWPLPVRAGRGYNFAEVTSGGVPLEEIDVAAMESRRCPGLHLVGEIIDVDGRIGGFNFQWAWSSGFVAGKALATAS